MRSTWVWSLALVFGVGCGELSGDRPGNKIGTERPGDQGDSVDESDETGPVLGHHPYTVTVEGHIVDVMTADDLAALIPRLPQVASPDLAALLESSDTVWYDKYSIIPAYQDSWGQDYDCSSCGPTGVRPNTIDKQMINLAVPGGHGQIFAKKGLFHFPFGLKTGHSADSAVVNFWHVPRDENDEPRPVVWWKRSPSSFTHRWEWMFPVGTVLGEILFVRDDGEWFPFEVRTRTRALQSWTIDVFRPFPEATDLANALAVKQSTNEEWEDASDIDALIEHLLDNSTLSPASLSSPHYPGAFPTVDLALDHLPSVGDDTILKELLLETPFRSAKGAVWKESGELRTYAAANAGGFSIVPVGYDGGFLRVDDESCRRCHRDAGRPFRDWYDNITAYGELWGEDESFTWHPFETDWFVTASGNVKNFNHGSRKLRSDFVNAGLVEDYDDAIHDESIYQKLPGAWKDYVY